MCLCTLFRCSNNRGASEKMLNFSQAFRESHVIAFHVLMGSDYGQLTLH